MTHKILTHLNSGTFLTLFLLWSMTSVAVASTDWTTTSSLDQQLLLPLQATPQRADKASVPQQPTRMDAYTPANYAAQALHTNTRSVNSYGGGHSTQAGGNALSGNTNPNTIVSNPTQAAAPTAIRDIDTWKRTRTSSPTLADDIALADDALIMKAPGGSSGGAIGDGNSDKDNTSAVVPLGEATWTLLLLAVVYALIRRKKMIIHTLNK